VASIYRVVWKTIKALVTCQQIKVKVPSSTEELKEAASGFESISTGGCISNCVTVVDGYHLEIHTPPKKYAKNVQSFFSGHYQSYGVNIQAACDHNCRFQFNYTTYLLLPTAWTKHLYHSLLWLPPIFA
jgi:hypothetical protein